MQQKTGGQFVDLENISARSKTRQEKESANYLKHSMHMAICSSFLWKSLSCDPLGLDDEDDGPPPGKKAST